MEKEASKRPQHLAQGQLWRLEHGYIRIVEMGKRLIHYELLKEPHQATLMSRLIAIEALAIFLRHSEAELVGANLVA